jgi:hypothetical protein
MHSELASCLSPQCTKTYLIKVLIRNRKRIRNLRGAHTHTARPIRTGQVTGHINIDRVSVRSLEAITPGKVWLLSHPTSARKPRFLTCERGGLRNNNIPLESAKSPSSHPEPPDIRPYFPYFAIQAKGTRRLLFRGAGRPFAFRTPCFSSAFELVAVIEVCSFFLELHGTTWRYPGEEEPIA